MFKLGVGTRQAWNPDREFADRDRNYMALPTGASLQGTPIRRVPVTSWPTLGGSSSVTKISSLLAI
ncbi:MAG: hypothetical protein ABIU95_04180 [Burkholderiales bacterium]